MSSRYDLPRIQATERPSRFNREAAFYGVGLGVIATGAALLIGGTIAAPLTLFAIAAGSTAFGALVGSSKGISRQKNEAITGRVVKDPTFLNLGITNGLFLAAAIGLAVVGGPWLAAAVGIHGTTAAAAAAISTFTTGLLAGHFPAWLIATGGAAAVGGSVLRHRTMQKEFDRSASVADQRGAAMAAYAPVQGMGVAPTLYKDSVSAQEAALLEAKQSAATSQTDKLSAARAVLADNQRQ